MADMTSPNTTLRRQFLIIIVIVILLMVFEFAGEFPDTATPLERLELAAVDTTFRLRGEATPNENIVIAAIDDQSLSWVGGWPWPRGEVAEIIQWLNDAGAKVIALDIFLFDPTDPVEDQALVNAMADANAIVSVNQIFTNPPHSITNNIPDQIFLDVLDGYGITEIERGDDAIVRGIKAYKKYQDDFYFNWAFEIAEAYLEVDPPTNVSLSSMTFNGKVIPLNQRGKMLVNFAGPAQTYPTFPAAYLPLGDYDSQKDFFKDKIVFIGASSETLQDLYPTPFSSTDLTPGVEVVANAVATILSGQYFRIAPPWVAVVLILIAGVIAWFISKIPRPSLAIGLMFGGIVGYIILRNIVFFQTGWQLAMVSPSLTLFLGVVIPTLEQAVTQEAEKRRVRGMFSRFISPEMVNQLLETQDINSLNKRTELTILFSDIRGFTSISERLSPEEVVSLLNPYLQVMSEVIHKHGGTVDKYEGDAIVAFFGEPIPHPDHAIRAARASVEMRQELKKLTRQWQAEGRFTDVFEMGIGLNTGEVFVGLLGSEQRVNYTVIGDTANMAARLQDLTKEFGHPVLLSQTTFEQIKREFMAHFVAERILRGRTEPVSIYRLEVSD